MKNLSASYILFVLLFSLKTAHAYPDFIGYGYSSCITCHYNGHGGGALNDYGRALFSTEITARDVFPQSMEEEDIASKSGFLVSKQLPWWFRPGAKYRGLWVQSNPGSKSGQKENFYNMQYDINLNFFLDKKQKYAFINTLGYTIYPRQFANSTEDKVTYWFAKEFYLRTQYSKNFWIYLGQLDKVFGIRQVDHTANSRYSLGLGQFDQSLGTVLHWTYPTWDIAVNAFTGNISEKQDDKQVGASVSGEYELMEKTKIGASALSSKSNNYEWKILAGHSRIGIEKGHALMLETGVFEKKTLASSETPKTAVYGILESLFNLRRGYNLLTVYQYSKADLKAPAPEKTQLAMGALMFPLPRTEIRLMAVNGKVYDESSGSQDSWSLQSQLHISW